MASAKVDWGSSLESTRPVRKPENGELGFVGGEGEEEERKKKRKRRGGGEEEAGKEEEEEEKEAWRMRRRRKRRREGGRSLGRRHRWEMVVLGLWFPSEGFAERPGWR